MRCWKGPWPLEAEVLAGLIIDRVAWAVLDLVEGEDVRLDGHAGDLHGHLGGNPPSRGAARVDVKGA